MNRFAMSQLNQSFRKFSNRNRVLQPGMLISHMTVSMVLEVPVIILTITVGGSTFKLDGFSTAIPKLNKVFLNEGTVILPK